MTAETVQRLPEGPEWIYEVKFDGYRALLVKNGTAIRIHSRNDKDLTAAYPHVRALLVGVYDGKQLRFAGKVRAGFTPRVRRDVFAQVQRVHAAHCPFVDLPNAKPSRWGGGVTAEQMREMQWLKPSLVAHVRFVEWTSDGHLRHAAFLGLRTDKDARSIRRET